MVPEQKPILFLCFFILVTFLLPVWMRRVRAGTKGLSPGVQLMVFLFFEGFLAVSVFLSFFCAWYAFEVALFMVPYFFSAHLGLGFLDAPLTPRGLGVLAFLIGFPLAVFFKVGVLAVRDVHQVCREQRDLVLKHYSLSWWWRGF